MDTFKFRGKRIDNGMLVYGGVYLNKRAGVAIIIIDGGADDGARKHVVLETVGQFIGLYDKNGNEIYSNDILGAFGSIETDKVIPPFIQVKYSDGSYNIGKESETDYVVMNVTEVKDGYWLEYNGDRFHAAPWEFLDCTPKPA